MDMVNRAVPKPGCSVLRCTPTYTVLMPLKM